MSINKIILCTIVASLFLFKDVENYALRARLDYPNATNNFTINQYLGVWYVDALMFPQNLTPEVSCEWYEVTEQYDFQQYFTLIYRKMLDGKSMMRYYGYGEVIKAEIHETYPMQNSQTVYTVIGFNDGNELILNDKMDTAFSRLISRKPRASLQARAEFERIASDAKDRVHYVNHTICQ